MDWSPLEISLKTALISTAITLVIGTLAAYYVIKLNSILKGIVDGILTLPMVLPPTVVGFFLLKIFGINGVVGKFFIEVFQTKIVFSFSATVISSTVVAFPLLYRSVRGTFEQLDKNLVYSAKTLGMSNPSIFLKVVIPNSRAGILAGCVLAFARALGEFGATIMLAGNLPGRTRTISTAVYSAMASGDDELAYKWVLVNLAISFTVVLAMNILSSRTRRERGAQ